MEEYSRDNINELTQMEGYLGQQSARGSSEDKQDKNRTEDAETEKRPGCTYRGIILH